MLDAEGTGDFNACVEGGRLREDVSATKDLLVYGQGVFAYSQTEQPSGACDASGRTIAPDVPAKQVRGRRLRRRRRLRVLLRRQARATSSARPGRATTRARTGSSSTASSTSSTPSPSTSGARGRSRCRGGTAAARSRASTWIPTTYATHWWAEGENYVALRMAPKWVFTQGFEYTTMVGQPLLYFNGAVLYKFTEQLQRARLRGRAARRLPLRERHLPVLSRLRGGAGRADAAVLEPFWSRRDGLVRGARSRSPRAPQP